MSNEQNNQEVVKPALEENTPAEPADLDMDEISGARPQPLYGAPGTN
jgi:hypothetical protein